MDSGRQRSKLSETGLRTTSGGGEQQLAGVPSMRDKLEKLIESVAEKFGEETPSVIPEVVDILRARPKI